MEAHLILLSWDTVVSEVNDVHELVTTRQMRGTGRSRSQRWVDNGERVGGLL